MDGVRSCGLDFGTSNSGVALPDGAGVRLAPLEGDATALPSAMFFPDEDGQPALFGRAAVDEYLDGTPGRLMRSLKTLLGSRLMHETTAVGARQLAYTDIVTLYLRTLRERACAHAGESLDAVVLGRPVRFDDDDDARDRDAQATLEACARAAGFAQVEFELEPIAAAFDYERTLAREALVLVIDVGGGTADFTVIRLAPGRSASAGRESDVLANAGVHVAGTDFDTRLNLAWTMPSLGYRGLGAKGRVVPSLVYFDLSTWHRIHPLYAPKFLGKLRELREFYTDVTAYARLARAIETRQGHRVLGLTERAKIELSQVEGTAIDLSCIERGLAIVAERATMMTELDALLARLIDVGRATVATAGVAPAALSTLYFTGGSSGMTALREVFAREFPHSAVVVGDLFGSVVSGLGLEAARRFGPR